VINHAITGLNIVDHQYITHGWLKYKVLEGDFLSNGNNHSLRNEVGCSNLDFIIEVGQRVTGKGTGAGVGENTVHHLACIGAEELQIGVNGRPVF